MRPHEFKSDIEKSLIAFIAPHITLVILIIGIILFINGFQFSILSPWYFTFLIPYSIGAFIYSGMFNNDIIIKENSIQFVNNVPFFKKTTLIDFNDIETIILRHDWAETFGRNIKSSKIRYRIKEVASLFFPYNYKWVKIKTYKGENFRFYCFGIEYDYYDNKGSIFEDLYKHLRKKHKSVLWTNNTEEYYINLAKITE